MKNLLLVLYMCAFFLHDKAIFSIMMVLEQNISAFALQD